MTEQNKLNAEELSGSLNYYDELAIAKHFGKPLEELSGLTTLRGLIFIDRRRAGLKDTEAFAAAAEVTLSGLDDLFEDDEPNPEDPTTESGKESEPYAVGPMS